MKVRLKRDFVHLSFNCSFNKGAFMICESEWSSSLNRIYVNIIDTQIRNKQRALRNPRINIGSSAKTSEGLDPSFLDLAVEVCHQVYRRGRQVCSVDVTQVVPLESTQRPESAPKRRRVEVTLDNVLDQIKIGGEERQEQKTALPWVELLFGILER